MTAIGTFVVGSFRTARTNARLSTAHEELLALTDADADDITRTAIAWGYRERLRLGLESPFRLIEAASRDPRLTLDEQRTVSWGLLGSVLRGESHRVDAAVLDGIDLQGGPAVERGDRHLALIEDAIRSADNPRAGELALRFAYALATAERLVEGSSEMLVAQVAALIADREIARREARQLVRSASTNDLIHVIARGRANRALYAERPVLMVPTEDLEAAAIAMVPGLLADLRSRSVRSIAPIEAEPAPSPELRRALYAAGARLQPAAALIVTLGRYERAIRSGGGLDVGRLRQARNPEMLVAVATPAQRDLRRLVGRIQLASAVAMRAHAQDPVWFPGDSAPALADVGVGGVTFDAGIPALWRPYYIASLGRSVADLKRVLPALRLDDVQVRFRATPPAESALAMHDPRSRTLHLPVGTAAGTLSHELAHDIDRQSAIQQGTAGYRSDVVSRSAVPARIQSGTGRVSASLRAMTEEIGILPRGARAAIERPAEIFATRLDWFVAQSLAREGISSGFLSAVQDEVLTGHVVHPDRLRGAGRSRSFLTALEGMTAVAPLARRDAEPTAHTIMMHVLESAPDRRDVGPFTGMTRSAWEIPMLAARAKCERSGRAALVRLAAESRVRGVLRSRVLRKDEAERAGWEGALLGHAPWDDGPATLRVRSLTERYLGTLSSTERLPVGVAAHTAELAAIARCASRE